MYEIYILEKPQKLMKWHIIINSYWIKAFKMKFIVSYFASFEFGLAASFLLLLPLVFFYTVSGLLLLAFMDLLHSSYSITYLFYIHM